MKHFVVGLMLALAAGLTFVAAFETPAMAACTVRASWKFDVEKCEYDQRPSRVAQSVKRSGPSRDGRSRRAICGVMVNGVCERGISCSVGGRAGGYYAVFGEGVKRPGRACLPGPRRAAAAPAPAPPVLSAGLVATAMRRLEWRAPRLTVQPPGGATLVNLPTIVFAGDAQTQTLTTTLLTQVVTIEARPVRYAWDFGDGARLVTAKPGRPYPDLDVAHRYPRPGRFRLTLATSFVGRFRAGDGPWRPIPGQLVLASTPQPLRVVEARPQLRGE